MSKITKGEFNILQKLLTSWAQRDKTLQETFTYTDKSKSLLVIQIQEAIGENCFSRGSLFKTWPKPETAHEKPLAPRVVTLRSDL